MPTIKSVLSLSLYIPFPIKFGKILMVPWALPLEFQTTVVGEFLWEGGGFLGMWENLGGPHFPIFNIFMTRFFLKKLGGTSHMVPPTPVWISI
jgi:hypothetical protein